MFPATAKTRLSTAVTEHAAQATQTTAKLGTLAVGKVADIAIFKQQGTQTYRSVVAANAGDVVLGTDTPLGPPHAIDATIADLDAAGLSDSGLAAVYAGNAQRLLGVR